MFNKLLKIQEEIGVIKKESTNPFYNSKYFDINALLAEVKPILNKNGVVLLQVLEELNGKNVLRTTITDAESKENVGGTVILPEVSDPQKFGSVLTYYRRYALQSLLALEAEDDDANVASGKKEAKVKNAIDDEAPF